MPSSHLLADLLSPPRSLQIAIPVHPLCRIHELKAYIAVREDLSLVEQNLVWAGSVLENDRTAASYGLTRSSILHVVQRTSESEYW